MRQLSNHHTKHLKEVYGEGVFDQKPFHATIYMNYGWATDDNSITTKIYKKDGNEFLTTYQIGKKFVYDSGKIS